MLFNMRVSTEGDFVNVRDIGARADDLNLQSFGNQIPNLAFHGSGQ